MDLYVTVISALTKECSGESESDDPDWRSKVAAVATSGPFSVGHEMGMVVCSEKERRIGSS